MHLSGASVECLAEYDRAKFVLFVELNFRAVHLDAIGEFNSRFVELQLGAVQQNSISVFIDL